MRRVAVIIFLFISTYNWAQVNLVPNYSFEDIDTCPNGITTIYNAHGWRSPSPATPDLYNSCVTINNGFGVPQNIFGFQFANQGVGYCGIILYFPNSREYIGVKLSDSLKINKYYCVKFYASISHTYSLSCSSIGVYFSPDSIYLNTINILPFVPQIENADSNFINDTTSWQLISGYFKADGGEKYMYIGNFRNDANTITQNFTPGSKSYVYIDNVQLYECDSVIGIKESIVKPLCKYYPNPSNGLLYLEKSSNESCIFELFDWQGRPVYSQRLAKGINKAEINVSDQPNGLYFCRITFEDGKVESGKLILQKE